MFYRKIESKILNYFKNPDSPILVIDGARQVGKTFIIREKASKYFSNYIEIDLKDDYENKRIFEKIKSTTDFYMQISLKYGDKLHSNKDTIIFLDEIQFYPNLLTLLKPLKKENKYRYIVSGSLLGVTLQHSFIPMGSITEEKMYPMDFEEFLIANGAGKDSINYLFKCYKTRTTPSENIHLTMLECFKHYLIVGGLPDAVKNFVKDKNIYNVRKVHDQTFNFYKDDASKYDKDHSLKISRIYELMISTLENKIKRLHAFDIGNKKISFAYYQDEFDYLLSSGIALGVNAISDLKFPLKSTLKKNLFKLYYNDVGLVSNLLFKNNITAILHNDTAVNLGALYETVAATELTAHNHRLYYYDQRKVGEVDYLLDDYDNLSILPIEIKSGKYIKEHKSINKITNDKKYKINHGYVFSNKGEIKIVDNIIYLPIYMIMFL